MGSWSEHPEVGPVSGAGFPQVAVGGAQEKGQRAQGQEKAAEIPDQVGDQTGQTGLPGLYPRADPFSAGPAANHQIASSAACRRDGDLFRGLGDCGVGSAAARRQLG